DILLYWNTGDFWMQPGDKLLPQLTVHARDWFEGQPIGRAAKELWDKGYAFDYISDAQLKTAKVAAGKIQMPGGNYQVIVVPECKYIPLETFEQLVSLAKTGATVIFQKQLPVATSGLEKAPEKPEKIQNLRNQIQSVIKKAPNLDFSESNLGKGKIMVGSMKDALVALPGDTIQENLASSGRLSFIRRSFDGGQVYFIANRTETNFDEWIGFNHAVRSTVLLDPMSGKSGLPAWREGQMRLQLAAGESVILRAFADKKVEGPAWNYRETKGQPVEVTGPWNVKFILGGPTLPADWQTAKLASWTTFPDTNCQAFAGTAHYTTTFEADDAKLELDLGDVRQSARVRVNGKDYGTLITPPFRVVVDNLKPAGNTLEVEVTSVAANRIRDLDRRGVPWKTFRDINIVNLDYKPFDASHWPLTDCGLLGPVTLYPVTASP
ncbi:MAG: glycosylhydrolase-like jelly roll fold domain-containing protein, partial [Verrucomicrobiota bacterium]